MIQPILRPALAALTLAVLAVAQEPVQEPVPAPAPSPSAPPAGEAPSSPDAQEVAERNQDQPAQVGQRRSPDIGREQMWRRPTAEDWAQPTLIQWQRTWDDAVELSERTGKPIMVAINMDGEIASEHYAGIRYRQPEVAALFEPYVCVMASVYRHTPRDHDEQGHRIECPRFGGITCGEHIALEPIVYDGYLDETRVSPRHVMVELDGSEVYDVYYAFDTASVFDAIREGIEERELEPYDYEQPTELEDLVASPDSADRARVEVLWREGGRAAKQSILNASAKLGPRASLDLLRLALFDVDPDLASQARRQLAATDSAEALDLMLEALRIPMETREREALVAALERLGEQSDRARTLAAVQRGLGNGPREIDVSAWRKALAGTGGGYAPAGTRRDPASAAARLDRADDTATVDGPARLEFAEASLAWAIEPDAWRAAGGGNRPVRGTSAEGYVELMLQDALTAAEEAEAAGMTGWRVDAAIALAAWYTGDVARAEERAVKAATALPPGATEWNAMAVLSIFADVRQRAIQAAVRTQQEWPREWMGDVHAAYSVLGAHPEGTSELVVKHYDFLRWMGAFGQANEVLDRGLERFPLSAPLHRRLRGRLLWERGARGLEQAWEQRLAATPDDAGQVWFAGLASIIAAESYRKQSQPVAADAAYARGIERYEQAIALDAANAESAGHYIAIALSGRARLALDAGDLAGATELLVGSIGRSPNSADVIDGLELSAIETARTLTARLREDGDEANLERLRTALATLRPEQLGPAPYEPTGPPTRTPDGRRDLRPDERGQ
ncbi:MAG: hypothetical protein AAFZ65_12055 [Planctomycetota bacterium]